MLIASHLLVAGYVGERIGDPFLAFCVGILLHFILDAIPHYDTVDQGKFTLRQYLLVIIDGIIGLTIAYFYLSEKGINNSFIFGALGGLLPDILDNSPFWSKQFQKTKFGRIFHSLHKKIQFEQPSPLIGLSMQVVIVVFFAILLLK